MIILEIFDFFKIKLLYQINPLQVSYSYLDGGGRYFGEQLLPKNVFPFH